MTTMVIAVILTALTFDVTNSWTSSALTATK
jgi:hypothetical protein